MSELRHSAVVSSKGGAEVYYGKLPKLVSGPPQREVKLYYARLVWSAPSYAAVIRMCGVGGPVLFEGNSPSIRFSGLLDAVTIKDAEVIIQLAPEAAERWEEAIKKFETAL